MTTSVAENSVSKSDWRLILLASLGGALEFYDFVVFGQFASYIGAAFFQNTDPMMSLVLSLSTFAVGYFARPIGGIFFSHIGDRLGRRHVLILTIVLMSGATTLMGLLPGYATWGLLAPVSLVLLRVVQGFCLGGELPGAISYVVETAPRRSGFSVGVIFVCINTGVMLAAVLNLVLQWLLTPEEISQWGWRLGFILGGILGIVSFFLRLTLDESKEFARIRAKGKSSAMPMAELFKHFPGATLTGVAVLAVSAGFNGLFFALTSFLTLAMGYSPAEAGVAHTIGLCVLSPGLLTVAWLSDRIPRKYLLMFGSGAMLLLTYPFFEAAKNHTGNLNVMLAFVGLFASFTHGTTIAICADLFPTYIRFTGVAMSFNFSFSILGGLAPVVITELTRRTGDPANGAYYLMTCALVSFLAALVMSRYDGRILGDLESK